MLSSASYWSSPDLMVLRSIRFGNFTIGVFTVMGRGCAVFELEFRDEL